MAAGGNRKRPLRTLSEDPELLRTIFHQSAGVEKLSAIFERVFNGVAVKVLVVDFTPVVTAARGFGPHRPRILHPTGLVNVMDAVVAENTPAGPEKVMKSLHLPEQFVHALRSGGEIKAVRWVVLPISRKGNEVSHFAAAQTGKEFAATVAVAAHKPDGDLEFFLIR